MVVLNALGNLNKFKLIKFMLLDKFITKLKYADFYLLTQDLES